MTLDVRNGLTRAGLVLCAMAGLGMACNPTIKSTLPGPPTAEQLAQLWVEPDRGRDLFWGVGGKRLAPDPSVSYQVIEIKRLVELPGETGTDFRLVSGHDADSSDTRDRCARPAGPCRRPPRRRAPADDRAARRRDVSLGLGPCPGHGYG